MMKVLFYADPTRLYETFARSADVLADHLVNFMGAALLRSGKVELKAVVSAIAAWQCRGDARFAGIELLPFGEEALLAVFPGCRSLEEMSRAFFRNELTEAGAAAFARRMGELLHGWTPDVVIAFPTNFGPLRTLFPQALCLIAENGIVSRSPFPRALRFEPVEFLNGFANRHADAIRALPVTDDDRRELARLAEGIRREIAARNPHRREMEVFRRRFRHTVLAPVPYANAYGESEWNDQYLWLTDVMTRLPRDIGVVATFHDNFGSQLNGRTAEHLAARFPNLLVSCGGGFRNQSLWFLPYVDATLNCETMTGFMGLLLGVPMIALDRVTSGWAANAVGLDAVVEALERPCADRAGALVWLLTRFTVLESRFDDADWYCRFLADKLAAFRKDGVTFDLMGPVERLGDVVDGILAALGATFAKFEAARAEKRRPLNRVLRKVGRHLAKLGDWLEACGSAETEDT